MRGGECDGVRGSKRDMIRLYDDCVRLLRAMCIWAKGVIKGWR